MRHSTSPLAFAVALALSACAAQPQKTESLDANGATACPATRPQVCTMIYDPVCATRMNGANTTEANNCSACANDTVVSYTQGACRE